MATIGRSVVPPAHAPDGRPADGLVGRSGNRFIAGRPGWEQACVRDLAASDARVFAATDPRKARGRRECRAAGRNPWPACRKESRRQSPQVRPTLPTFPARWFADYTRSSRGPAVLPPFATMRVPRIAQASAPGCQNHAISPSHRIVRPRETRAPTPCAHRIPHPTSMTTAKRPLCGTGYPDQTTTSDKAQ